MKQNEIKRIVAGMSLSERAEVAANLLLAGCEAAATRRAEQAKQKNEAFWNGFDNFALEILTENGGAMSLIKFETAMKARRYKTPTVENLRAHGYTVEFNGFLKISL